MRLKMVVAKRVPSKVAQLTKQFGGAWKYYYGNGCWVDVGSERYVVAVASCSCDYDCGSSPRYFLHEKGKASVEVMFDGQPFHMCRGMR